MYTRILVPVDGSAPARRGLDEAIELAERLGASLHLIHVIDARMLISEASLAVPPAQVLDDWRDAGDTLVRQAVAHAQERGVVCEGAVRCDPGFRVFELILKEAADCGAQLIVMGTHGRRGLQRLALGSDAEMVVRDSTVPVLLVRSADR